MVTFVGCVVNVDCMVNPGLCDSGRIADVPMLAPPALQPATIAAQSLMASTPLMRFYRKSFDVAISRFD
jgi:hypothetical protein